MVLVWIEDSFLNLCWKDEGSNPDRAIRLCRNIIEWLKNKWPNVAYRLNLVLSLVLWVIWGFEHVDQLVKKLFSTNLTFTFWKFSFLRKNNRKLSFFQKKFLQSLQIYVDTKPILSRWFFFVFHRENELLKKKN